MLSGMINYALSIADESSKRRAIDDGSTSLLVHMLQLKLHATPYPAQIDSHHSVVIFPGRFSSLAKDILNASIVVGCIEPLPCDLGHSARPR